MKQHERVTLAAAAAGAVLSLALPGIGPSQAHQALPPGIVAKIPQRHAGVDLRAPTLVEQGRRLFEEETFGGNGRTCASCHPASNNFTIDVPYINTLPADDPLFVAEFNPALKDLEIPGLLRGKGLICENLDGFDRPCVLRSVPHTLALGLSGCPTGWVPSTRRRCHRAPRRAADLPAGGGTGLGGRRLAGRRQSLRNFAVGAVVQHFPKTLNRVEGSDFRLPTADELDAMEAFQLSLGRQAEMNLNPNGAGSLRFADLSVAQGQNLFFNGAPSPGVATPRTCSGCHTQAGAGTPNRNRATGAERSPLAPPCISPLVLNGDGGFGQGTGLQESAGHRQRPDPQRRPGRGGDGGPRHVLPRCVRPVTFIGTTFFNPPPVGRSRRHHAGLPQQHR